MLKRDQFLSGSCITLGLILTIVGSQNLLSWTIIASAATPSPTQSTIQLGTFSVPPNSTPTPKPSTTPNPSSSVIPSSSPTGSITPSTTPMPSVAGDTLKRLVKTSIDDISEANIKKYISDLVDDDSLPGQDQKQSRHVNFNQKVEAAYVKKFYDDHGIQNEYQNIPSANGTNNIIATIPGENTNQIYVLVGHLDTRGDSNRFDGRNSIAPGADDNGSGTASLMEIARVLKANNIKPKYTIKILHTTGHEMDCVCLPGTQAGAQKLASEFTIRGVINMDMIGFPCSGFGDCIDINYTSRPGEKQLADKVASINSDYAIGLNVSTRNNSQASDHSIFSAMGIPSVFTFEHAFSSNPNYHAPTDRMESLSFSQITKDAKMVIGAVTMLANE